MRCSPAHAVMDYGAYLLKTVIAKLRVYFGVTYRAKLRRVLLGKSFRRFTGISTFTGRPVPTEMYLFRLQVEYGFHHSSAKKLRNGDPVLLCLAAHGLRIQHERHKIQKSVGLRGA